MKRPQIIKKMMFKNIDINLVNFNQFLELN